MRIELFDSISSPEWRRLNHISGCRITMHKFKKGEINEKVIREVTYVFHPSGKIQEMVYNEGDRRLINTIAEDSLIVYNVIMAKSDTLIRKTVEYDENKRLKRITQSGGDARYFLQTTDYQYTDAGKVADIFVHHVNKRYPEGGYEAYRQTYRYDEKGRLAEQQTCKRVVTGAIVADQIELKVKELTPAQCGYRTVFYFTDKDEPVKADAYYPDYMGVSGHIPVEGPRNYYTWIRNEEGKATEFQNISYKDNKLVAKEVVQYNQQGKTMKKEVYRDGFLVSRIVQGFNPDNQISTKISYARDNTMNYMTTFRYDDKGVKTHIISHSTETRKPEKAYVLEYQ